MHLIKSLVAAVAVASTATAAPTENVKNMMAEVPHWIIHDMKRTCDKEDKSCEWTFRINTQKDPQTPCKFKVVANEGKKASRSNLKDSLCGVFTVSSGWSDHFGPENGFTVLSIRDYHKKLIIWPGYTDKALKNGVVVVPDQSHAPAHLP